MKITYLGTTMLLFDDGKNQLLFDCHVSRPSIPTYAFGKLQTDQTTANKVIQQFQINRLRAIFISHSHHDHVMDMPFFAEHCGSDVYGTESTCNVARGGGITEEKLHVFETGKLYQIGKYSIKVLKSIHSKPGFFNNDLGQTIDEPLIQPAKKKLYKEGGSYDFIVEHEGRTYLIRPSYNFIPGQLDGIHADVLFLAIAGLAEDEADHKCQFWRETIEKVQPDLVIPIHWDNFFTPLYGPIKSLPKMFEFTGKSLYELSCACADRHVPCVVQLPLTTMEY